MVVYTTKTQLLVISDTMGQVNEAFIEDAADNELTSSEQMKVLGFYFSTLLDVSLHVEILRRRFRQKYWVLLHLREFGFNKEELAKVYRTIVRPVADYCSVVYHAMLTDETDESLEKCQSLSLIHI